MRKIIQVNLIVALITGLPWCPPALAGGDRYEFFSPYLQRSDGVTRDAGDAKEVNTVTHKIDPWPRYVSQRRIPANGERMSGAIERYRDISKSRLGPATLAPMIAPSSTSSSAAAPAAPSAPTQ